MSDETGKQPPLTGAPDEEEAAIIAYRNSLQELSELQQIESQYNKTTEDLSQTRDKLTSLEDELRHVREEETRRKQRVDGLFKQAREKEHRGLLREALEEFLEVLEYQPGHARSLHAIEEIKKQLSREESEKERYLAEQQKKEQESQALFESGKRLYREGQFEKALLDFNQAILLGGRKPELLEFKEQCESRCNEVEEAQNRAKKESEERGREVQKLLLDAHAYERDNKFSEAIHAYEQILLIEPDQKEAADSLVAAERRMKEFHHLEEKKRREEEEKLCQIREIQIRGMQHYREGRLDEALSSFESVLNLDPAREDVLQDMRRIQEEIKDRESRRIQEMQLIKDQQESESKRRQEVIQAQVEKEKALQEELDKQRQILEGSKQKTVREKYAEGIHLLTLGRHTDAMEAFAVVMAEDPGFESVERYVQLIRDHVIEDQLRRREKEMTVRNQEMSMQKEYMDAALKFLTQMEYEAALPYLEKILALDPEDPFAKKELEHARHQVMVQRQNRLQEEQDKSRREASQQRAVECCIQARRYWVAGAIDRALENYQRAMEHDSQNEDAAEGVRDCEIHFKEEARKKQAAEEAIKEHQALVERLHFQALEALRNLQFEEAVAGWRKLLEVEADFKEAQKGILVAECRIRDKGLCESLAEKAREGITRQTRLLKEVQDLAMQADQDYQTGQYDKSIKHWNQLIHQLPFQD